jgi:DHA3 family macrolide efflux protein-like MFS transporter
MNNDKTPKSMRTFLIIWIGQLISILGSGITGFGLAVWIYTETGQATPFALTALFSNLPRVLLSPIAGSVADRYNRKKIMILADTASALVTLGVAVLVFLDGLQIWHIYVISTLHSVFGTFQDPAYRASITMIVPKKDLARAGGIQQIGGATQSIVIPLLAGLLYGLIGLRGVIIIDFVTFFFAIGALMFVAIPQPQLKTGVVEGEKPSMWRDALFGWRYLVKLPGLFVLLWYYAVVNFFLNMGGVLAGPLILSFSGSEALGVVQTAGGIAMLIGGILMGTWGGPKKRRIWGVIFTIFLSGFGYLFMGLRQNVWLISIGEFVFLFFIPISAALSQVVWQTKIPADVQGRVFAIRSMIAYSIIPLSNLVAGPLADQIFEPLMSEGGALANTFLGDLFGVGPGRGIAVIFAIAAVFLWVVSLAAFAYPRLRNVEEEVPDAIEDDEEEEALPIDAQLEPVPAD